MVILDALAPDTTEGRLIYELGDRQWDVPRLRELLEAVLPRDSQFKIDASTSHGRITNAFSFTTTGKGTKTHIEGQTTTNPSVSLKVHTSNGNIALENATSRE